MAPTCQEVYRIKYRIAHGDKAHTHHPLEIEAWVVGGKKPDAKAEEEKPDIANRIGGVAKHENVVEPEDITAIRQTDTAARKDKTVKAIKADARKGALKPDDASKASLPEEETLDLQGLLSRKEDPDAAAAVPEVRAERSLGRKQDKAFDADALSGDSVKSETPAEAIQAAGVIDMTGKLADTEGTLGRNGNRARKLGFKQEKETEAEHGHEMPLSTKPITIRLTPPEDEQDKDFQAILHVHLTPENAAPYLQIDATTLDVYKREGQGQVLRVDYYRPARHVLGVHDVFDYDSKHAGDKERAAAGALKLDDLSMQADDLAVMARVYFLTQISAARRAFLRDLRQAAQLYQQLEAKPDHDSKKEQKQKRKERQKHKRELKEAQKAACRTVWQLNAEARDDKHAGKPSVRQYFENWGVLFMKFFAALFLALPVIRVACKLLIAVICLATILAALGFIWAPYLDLPTAAVPWRELRPVFGYITLTGAIIVGLIFLFFALNFRTLAERAGEMLIEWRTHRFADLVASLGSANANVAASRIGIKWARYHMDTASVKEESVELCVPWIPEGLLARFDEQLHVKERLTSLERVLKAHDTQTAEKMHHIEEDRARARRTVTAAASGIFVGLVTSEVGEMVLQYQHVAGSSDQNALLYWLVEQREAIAGQASHSAAEGAGHHSSPEHEYAHRFHHEELWAHSLLLTITLVFSLIAAWIAIRKPASEQAGGHGHH